MFELLSQLCFRFLEEYEDPFITKLESHASLAYACVCQVIQGLDLLAPSSDLSPPTEIALGLLSLWPYSLEHWIEHLLECFEVDHHVIPTCLPTLVDRVSILCRRLLMLGSPRQQVGVLQTGMDQRLVNLMKRVDPSVSNLIGELCKVNSWTNDDQSPLAGPMRAYQSVINSLIQADSVDGISTETLLAFKELHGPTGFLCSVRGCQHAIIGFPSKEKLNDHEALHSQQLKCFALDCFYNDVGFKTIKGLRDHKRRCHESTEPDQVAKRLCRVVNNLPEVGHQDLIDENDWDYIVNPEAPNILRVTPHRFIPAPSPLYCTDFSPDGKQIAVGGNLAAFVFEVRTGTLLQEFSHNADREYMWVQSVCFSPGGKHLATGGQDCLVRVRCQFPSFYEHG